MCDNIVTAIVSRLSQLTMGSGESETVIFFVFGEVQDHISGGK